MISCFLDRKRNASFPSSDWFDEGARNDERARRKAVKERKVEERTGRKRRAPPAVRIATAIVDLNVY